MLMLLLPVCSPQAAHHGFVLSVVRKMQVYLAVPGEVLASATWLQLQAELQDSDGNSRTDSTVGAAGSSKRSSKGSSRRDRQPPRWYKGADLMVLRR